MAQLQEYVDRERQSHYMEGNYSEYIMPNWTLFCRESSLYADVIGNEDADPVWNSPVRDMVRFGGFEPASYQVANALAAFGGFTIPGLKILREVWGEVNFEGDQDRSISRELYDEMACKLHSTQLITERATNDHARALVSSWQIPMYHIDFSRISVPLKELRERREMDVPYDY